MVALLATALTAAPPPSWAAAAPPAPDSEKAPTAVPPGPLEPTPSAPVPDEGGAATGQPGLVLEKLGEPPGPDQPVARVEGQLTVKGGEQLPDDAEQEPLAGPEKVGKDKEWLAQICPVRQGEGSSWLDRSHERLGWSVCRATLWFDGLFGDERAIAERDATFGYVQPGLKWREHDGVNPELRVRAKINLPIANRKFNALLGRDDAEDRNGRIASSSASQLPESFLSEDDQWLVGLGYSPLRGARRRLDFGAGLELHSSPVVFLQGRYRRHFFLSERSLSRVRPSVFWRSDDGLGTGLLVDFEWLLSEPFVARWRQAGTYAQRTDGVEWFEELTLFHRVGDKTAFAYAIGADGGTQAEVRVRRYFVEVTYRRNVLRDWLFMELRPGLDWRRRAVELDREIQPVLGVGLQIQFGDRNFE